MSMPGGMPVDLLEMTLQGVSQIFVVQNGFAGVGGAVQGRAGGNQTFQIGTCGRKARQAQPFIVMEVGRWALVV